MHLQRLKGRCRRCTNLPPLPGSRRRQRLKRPAYFLVDVRLVNSAFHDDGPQRWGICTRKRRRSKPSSIVAINRNSKALRSRRGSRATDRGEIPDVKSVAQPQKQPQQLILWTALSRSGSKYGERGRNRTFNLLIKSQLLCQLSYAPTVGNSQVGQSKIIAFLLG